MKNTKKEWKSAISANLPTSLIIEIDEWADARRFTRSDAVARLISLGLGTSHELEDAKRAARVAEARAEVKKIVGESNP